MAGELQRLLYEAGRGSGQYGMPPVVDYERSRFTVLPERDELDEAAGLLLGQNDRVLERFGITAFQAFEKLVESAIKRRLRIVPLTRRFIQTLG